MHFNTLFSLPVLISIVLLVSCASMVISEADSISKSIAGSSSSSAAAGSSAPSSAAGSSVSSAAAGSSASSDARGVSSSSSAADSDASAYGFRFTGLEVQPLPPPGLSNPIPNPVPNPLPLPPCTPNPEYIPPSGSIFANAPVVTLFTNAFLDYGYSNTITRELFNISMVPVDWYADYVRRKAERCLINLGVEDAASIVQFLYESIMRNFGCSGCPQLSLAVVIRKTANFIAHVMYVENLLTLDNAESLGLAYAKTLAHSASVTMTSDPTSKVQALCNGEIEFLQSFGLCTKEKAQTIIFYDGTEWYKAASDYSWW